MNKSKLLAFARLIKCLREVQTDQALLISENDIEVGTEVYVTDQETGELVLAHGGVYETDNLKITVGDNGVVESIEEKEKEPITEVEETTEVLEEETTVEETTEEPVVEEDEKDKKIAELEEKIAELEAIIAEYKEKETKTEPTVEEEEEEETKMSKHDAFVAALNKRNK